MLLHYMATIAVEQFLTIREGGRGKRSKLRVYVFIIISWLMSIAWALPPLFGWSRYAPEILPTSCSYDYSHRRGVSQYFLLSVVVCDFVIVITCVFNTLVYLLLRKQKKYLTENNVTEMEHNDPLTRDKTFTQCRLNVGPLSTTLGRYETNIDSTSSNLSDRSLTLPHTQLSGPPSSTSTLIHNGRINSTLGRCKQTYISSRK